MRGAGCVEMSRFECHARGAKQGGARKARGDGGERPRRAEPSRWVSRLRSTRTAEEYGRKRPEAADPPRNGEGDQMGRAACRERGWQGGCISGGDVRLKKK